MVTSLSFLDLGFALAAGALTTLSPCVFPVLPLVMGGATSRHRFAPIAMGLGMVAAFALIGLILGTVGAALGIDADVLRTVGAVLLIGFGVTLCVPRFGEVFTRLLSPVANRANTSASQLTNDTLLGAFALGGVLGLVWSPCSGPLLASALALVASKGGALTGTIMLAVFGLGAATPLVAIAYASKAGFGRSKTVVMQHIGRIKTVFGVLMVCLGGAILLGYDKRFEAAVLNLLPDAWIDLTTRF